MAIAVCASVPGGCIEDDLIHRVRDAGACIEWPETVECGFSAHEAHGFGLP